MVGMADNDGTQGQNNKKKKRKRQSNPDETGKSWQCSETVLEYPRLIPILVVLECNKIRLVKSKAFDKICVKATINFCPVFLFKLLSFCLKVN